MIKRNSNLNWITTDNVFRQLTTKIVLQVETEAIPWFIFVFYCSTKMGPCSIL